MAKIEEFKKKELEDYCKSIGISIDKKTKKMLIEEIKEYKKNEIREAIQANKASELLFS
ncbi:MAG TPA: restriction endonuclease, partial [Phaeodactylibacter sp.]|nr:restriction endonuclease [Phaeodactylibacter sp.]